MKLTFGGYVGFDVQSADRQLLPGPELLSSGRACIATAIRMMQPKRVYAPHFICDSALLPMNEAGIPIEFYSIDKQFSPSPWPDIAQDEMLIIVNYFGLCAGNLHERSAALGARAMLDHSQAFFAHHVEGCWSFNSARKFFGVPDGAQLFVAKEVTKTIRRNERVTNTHLTLASERRQAEGLQYHHLNEGKMSTAYELCSTQSQHRLERTDRKWIKKTRTENFKKLHEELQALNTLEIQLSEVDGPYHYPLVLSHPIDLAIFHRSGIYSPRLWQDVKDRTGSPKFETGLVDRLVALPIDQRCSEQDMLILADRVKQILAGIA